MCNVAIVLRPDDLCACALSKYFEERHQQILGASERVPFDF
jgi:hypothetical protein